MSKRQKYYLKQKLIGVLMLILTAAIVLSLHDATVMFVLVPIGLCLIFSRKMIITDSYFFEVKERKERL